MTNQRKRLAQNAVFLMGSDTIARVANVLFVVVAARLLGVDGYGVYATLMTFLLFGMMMSQLGLQSVITRDVARRRELASEYFSSAVALSLPLALLLWVLFPPLAVFFGYDMEIGRLLGLLGAALLGHAVARPAEGVLRAYEKMRLYSILRILISVLTAAIGVAALAAGYGITTLVLVHVVSSWLEAVILILAAHRHATPLTFKPSAVMARRAATDGFLLFMLMLFDLITRRFDVLILARLAGAHSVGLYVVCTRILEYAAIFRTGTIGALFPFLASRSERTLDTLANGYNQALRLFVIYAFGLAVPLIFGAPEILRFAFGTDFLPATSVLRILSFAMVAQALCGPVAAVIIISRSRLRELVGAVALLSLLNVSLDLWLMPRWAQNGAAVAALMTAAVGLFARTWLIGLVLGPRKVSLRSLLWRPAIAACTCLLCFVLLGVDRFWLAFLPASAVYMAVLVTTGGFLKEETGMVRETLGRLLTRRST